MDVDIDFPTNFDPLEYFDNAIRASMIKKGQLVKHPAGAYFQTIPVDPKTGLAAIPHKEAANLGYFKVDFLHLSVLDWFSDKNQIRTLLRQEPDWALLEDPDEVAKLFQIHKHFRLVDKVKPTTVIELADIIALIRPGKRKLLATYLADPKGTRKELYNVVNKGDYKKSHAVAYALTIVLQLHLIKGGIL